jgi:hypothetical protein
LLTGCGVMGAPGSGMWLRSKRAGFGAWETRNKL